eukprot:TRINITY_DN51_c0_g1_i3.p9 TRINITY_DN51_c0_g1~~TRINITY_DN51_c0_g1_i3.p9  ORF type:complete len:143 (+),score=22.63 TRINITY_DN51_c0_g1_i3:1422-1850(+)
MYSIQRCYRILQAQQNIMAPKKEEPAKKPKEEPKVSKPAPDKEQKETKAAKDAPAKEAPKKEAKKAEPKQTKGEASPKIGKYRFTHQFAVAEEPAEAPSESQQENQPEEKIDPDAQERIEREKQVTAHNQQQKNRRRCLKST